MKAKWLIIIGALLCSLGLSGVVAAQGPSGQIEAVPLIGAWVDAGAPETAPFSVTGTDGKTYEANFNDDILPLFTTAGLWYDKAQACSECHFAASKDSYHEMDLKTYKGILTGADSVSSPDNPEEIIIPGDWENSSLRARLRNNRMPPGMPFVLDESNRNGPIVTIGQVGAPPELPKTGAERPTEWLNLGLVAAGLGLMSVGFFLRRLSRRA